jgi:glycosyltransferase involved in cell wall biosynthesis
MSTNGDKKLHILLLPSWYPKQRHEISGSFFREQALALYKHGNKVGVITPALRPLRSCLGKFGVEYENDEGVNTYRSHGMKLFPPISRIRTLQWLYHGKRLFECYVKKFGLPDVIHVHSALDAGLLAVNIKLKYGVPFVVTEHSTAFARGLFNARQLQDVKMIAANASRNIAVSSAFATLLNKLCHSNARWEVLPNILSDKFINTPLLGQNQKGFIFNNTCIQGEKKKVDLLIRSFTAAFRGNKEVYLELGGGGEQHEKLKLLVDELGMNKQILFLGPLSRDEVVKHIAQSNVFVLSSQYETFGVVAIEALALGKPVIATRCGGPEDIVTKEDGLLVPVNDQGALTNAMKTLYANYSNYSAHKLRESCRVRFSEASVVAKLQDIYQSSIDKPKCSSRKMSSNT